MANASQLPAFWLLRNSVLLLLLSLLISLFAIPLLGFNYLWSKWCLSEVQLELEVLSSCFLLLLLVYFGQIPRVGIWDLWAWSRWHYTYVVFLHIEWEKTVAYIILSRHISTLNDMFAYLLYVFFLTLIGSNFISPCACWAKLYPTEKHHSPNISNLP